MRGLEPANSALSINTNVDKLAGLENWAVIKSKIPNMRQPVPICEKH